MNIAGDGSYNFQLPYLLTAKTEFKMRTIDVANRVSMGTKRIVKQTVPAKPTMRRYLTSLRWSRYFPRRNVRVRRSR